jgi:folate-binding protein YgfZ
MSNPFVDQRRLVDGDAAVRVHAGVVRVTGPDRFDVLNATLSQDLRGLAVGESRDALELDGNGRIQRSVHVLETSDGTLLIVPATDGADFATWLDRRIFMEDVQATDATSEFSVWGGSRAFGDIAWTDPWPDITPGGVTYSDTAVPSWTWVETLLPANSTPPVDIVDAALLDPIRVVAGRPAMNEIDDRSLPHELDWLRTAVHLSKGCYPGQETVAKIHNVGHPPRRLVRLHLDGSESVFAEAGDAVMSGDDVVGIVTTAGNHFEDGPVALAVIKRTVDVAESVVVVHDEHPLAANQQVIVPPTAGATAAERLRPSRP